ncbi:MAG: thiamine diphosphokinase [Clostridia bacterium]|nr:thiamine diphosphokinase [Clostridia bacterium]
MNKCVIIGNGPIEDISIFKELLNHADYIICADGGLNHLNSVQIIPQLILGDLDSVKEEVLQQYDFVEQKTFPKRKDATDSELALDYAIALNPKELVMLGFTGGRLDHCLTNMHMLKRVPTNIRASLVDAHNKVYYCESDFEYQGQIGENLSIIPVTEKVTGITTEGLDYPLCNETLYLDGSRGVSNVLKASYVKIETQSGSYFVILSKD